MNKEVYVEIDTKIIQDNIKKIKDRYNDYSYYIGVVKGNCYGHGVGIIKAMVESGINYLAVSTLEEALIIRKVTSIPILCMQPIFIEHLSVASDNDITITISNYDYYQEVLKQEIPLKVHLKLNTGMNRLGISDKYEVEHIYNELINNKYISLEGIYTHMQTIGLVDSRWDEQINRFLELTSLIELNKIKIVHIYNTNSLVIHPKLSFCSGVRLGILMYGVAPKPQTYKGFIGSIRKAKHRYVRLKNHISNVNMDYYIEVKPAFQLISKVVEINNVKKGEYVGYGLKYKLKFDSRVAIVHIGYADGLSLNHSLEYVYINKKQYQVIGSINMKMITILVDDSVKINDRVEIIHDNIRQICHHNKVTPHFLFTTIPSNIERIYK